METLSNGYTLALAPGAFPLSTDSMVLADFVRLPKNASVLDLGSGCGTLGLLLCAKDAGCTVTGIELDENAHLAALDNIRRNSLQTRLYSLCADLRSMPENIRLGSYHCCVSNPPYFSGGQASRKTPLARRNDCCGTEELFAAAEKALRYGGDFFLVQKPERLAELIHQACAHALEPKVLRLVRHHPGSSPGMILLQCRKGAKPGLKLEEITLFYADGTPTDDHRRIYHDEGESPCRESYI